MTSRTSTAGSRGVKALARASVLMATVALSACGGGGGGGSAPPPPPPPPPPAPAPAPAPAPTLTLNADASSADAGGQAIALHATLTGSAAPVTWTLAGPGALSASTGADVLYTPPDTESLDDAQKATISAASAGAATTSVDIALAPVDKPGLHWTLVRSSAPTFIDVAQGNGMFVATAMGGTAHSVDGLTWSAVTTGPSPQMIVWGEAGWVGIDNQGGAFTSSDGISWTSSPSAVPQEAEGILFGNHTYLAYGQGQSAVSTDGVHWTTVNLLLSAAAFGNGQFMALRQTPGTLFHDVHPWASADGIHWNAVTDVANPTSLAFANGQFEMDLPSFVEVSGDGSTWIGSNPGPNMQDGLLQSAGNALFDLNFHDMGVQLPGAAWQRTGTGSFLSMPASIAANGQRYVGVSHNGWIETSTDALSWSTQVEGSYGALTAIDFVDGRFVALSTLDRVMRSTDGVNWTTATMLGSTYSPILYPQGIAHDGSTVVAVGSAGDIAGAGGPNGLWLRSTDGGATWAIAGTTAPSESLGGVTYDGHRFVAISVSGKVYASPDGDAWGQVGAAPASSRYNSISFGAGVYLANASGVTATSPDGVTWTTIAPLPAAAPANTTAQVTSATWDGTQFVVVGYAANISGSSIGMLSATSADGSHWTARISDTVVGIPGVLARCGGELVAVGTGVLASSTDGLAWHARGQVAGATQLSAVACGNDRFVGAGPASAIVTSTR
ncbi:WD40/YVTN/BNR-like repeat-containing protein [Scleromatobacter humisilvae]|uniref:Exo-alpha-sialidase n=1 Tax=Scleromatobacter humisilvae TaxID=2897159 RepID=A0A9X1YI31_9BURK|nr:hypothetical protein [Scleromatobacter humisilvae]MCK9686744.1 hypothetical protein [Scleromatobacter humisilvae]